MTLKNGYYYKIVAKHSSKLLDIDQGSTSNAATLIQWEDHDGDNQIFGLAQTDEAGCFRIMNKNSWKFLQKVGGVARHDIEQWEFVGKPTEDKKEDPMEVWKITPVPEQSGYFTISSKSDNSKEHPQVITVRDAEKENGVVIHMSAWQSGNNDHQVFEFKEVGPIFNFDTKTEIFWDTSSEKLMDSPGKNRIPLSEKSALPAQYNEAGAEAFALMQLAAFAVGLTGPLGVLTGTLMRTAWALPSYAGAEDTSTSALWERIEKKVELAIEGKLDHALVEFFKNDCKQKFDGYKALIDDLQGVTVHDKYWDGVDDVIDTMLANSGMFMNEEPERRFWSLFYFSIWASILLYFMKVRFYLSIFSADSQDATSYRDKWKAWLDKCANWIRDNKGKVLAWRMEQLSGPYQQVEKRVEEVITYKPMARMGQVESKKQIEHQIFVATISDKFTGENNKVIFRSNEDDLGAYSVFMVHGGLKSYLEDIHNKTEAFLDQHLDKPAKIWREKYEELAAKK